MYRLLFSIFLPAFLIFSSSCLARTVDIPIRLDYQLLQSLITESFYTDTGQTAQLVNEANGCVTLTLSRPRFTGGNGTVDFATDVSVHAGTPLGEKCLLPFTWQGSIKAAQIPTLDPSTYQLTFKTTATELYSADGNPVGSLNAILKHMVPSINSYVQDFSVNLAPPINDLKRFIFPLFNRSNREQAEKLLQTMKPGATSANSEGITTTILLEVADTPAAKRSGSPETLTEEELAELVELWETWDSLLVFIVSLLSEQLLTESEKQVLIDLLLDTRHQFVAGISDNSVRNDFVRKQFINGWQTLSPLFRRHLLNKPGGSELGYLSFFTAADALMILDELGPAVGIEISRDGLIRLARMLGEDSLELNHHPDLNESLQELFEITPKTKDQIQHQSEDGSTTSKIWEESVHSLLGRTVSLLFPEAHASSSPSPAEIYRWKPPRSDIHPYLERVLDVLHSSSGAVIGKKDLSTEVSKLYQNLIPAIAWQESCFRQFVVEDSKLTYLLSYNNSSVGIMQVNERIWRGIYDRHRLRWDIEYNARAGCEIAARYLQRYALRRATWNLPAEGETLAQLVYAMYNGGPAQYDRFMKRKAEGKLYRSDRLFAGKYDWVTSQAWDNIGKCL
jgi:hypothetical protein